MRKFVLPEVLEEGEGEARDEVRLGGGVPDVLAERRGVAPKATGPRGRGPHRRRGAAAAAAGRVGPRQERARLLDGGPHCECEAEPPAPAPAAAGRAEKRGDSNWLLAGARVPCVRAREQRWSGEAGRGRANRRWRARES